MNRETHTRNLLIAALVSALALSACDRKSETHDPDSAAPAETPTTTEQPMDDTGTTGDGTTTPDTTSPGTTAPGTTTDPGSATGDSATSGSMGADSTTAPGADVEVCSDTWFKWVNDQVVAMHSEVITQQYPSGLPEVGSDEWFVAVDKLTGGDGAHGPDGGSDEWCAMVQQRLSKAGTNNQ